MHSAVLPINEVLKPLQARYNTKHFSFNVTIILFCVWKHFRCVANRLPLLGYDSYKSLLGSVSLNDGVRVGVGVKVTQRPHGCYLFLNLEECPVELRSPCACYVLLSQLRQWCSDTCQTAGTFCKVIDQSQEALEVLAVFRRGSFPCLHIFSCYLV